MADIFPPRGSDADGVRGTSPSATWQHPAQLGPEWDWKAGHLLLGVWDKRLLGLRDDRHAVMLAGSRAGKTSSVLIPNLRRYPGSAIVLDPKGELVKKTKAEREAMGQRVFVLDPFRITDATSSSHNPFDELGKRSDLDIAPDAAQIAEAMIIASERDTHWTDAARNYIRGLVLYMRWATPDDLNIKHLRHLLHYEGDNLHDLLVEMASADPDLFNGVIHNVGMSYKGKFDHAPGELQSILSTAREQTNSLDDVVDVMMTSDFELADLKRQPMTVYLVLPATRLGTHYRWLRLLIQQAFAAMERTPHDDDDLPVWFVLEEFASLGYMRTIETAAGFMAGFNIKLWSVLQDLTQLKTHYKNSWETFLGNAGIIQAFGNFDWTTTEHLSKLLGHTHVTDVQDVFVSSDQRAQGDTGSREHIRQSRLIEPNEITRFFSRETNRQIIIVPGERPIYMQRLGPEGRDRKGKEAGK